MWTGADTLCATARRSVGGAAGDSAIAESAPSHRQALVEERGAQDRAEKRFSAPGYDPEVTITVNDGALGAARCATSVPLFDVAALRAVVDGEFNSSAHYRQMTLLIRKTATCGMGSQTIAYLSDPFPASETELENRPPWRLHASCAADIRTRSGRDA
ncbi:hypothetical protein [uncultured Sphingomonas sp.]|uniref:hypothetical protein n=1 Tax=uncultured Sphingomonas sp. TaxID=158754 RepID=UPI003748325C